MRPTLSIFATNEELNHDEIRNEIKLINGNFDNDLCFNALGGLGDSEDDSGNGVCYCFECWEKYKIETFSIYEEDDSYEDPTYVIGFEYDPMDLDNETIYHTFIDDVLKDY